MWQNGYADHSFGSNCGPPRVDQKMIKTPIVGRFRVLPSAGSTTPDYRLFAGFLLDKHLRLYGSTFRIYKYVNRYDIKCAKNIRKLREK